MITRKEYLEAVKKTIKVYQSRLLANDFRHNSFATHCPICKMMKNPEPCRYVYNCKECPNNAHVNGRKENFYLKTVGCLDWSSYAATEPRFFAQQRMQVFLELKTWLEGASDDISLIDMKKAQHNIHRKLGYDPVL